MIDEYEAICKSKDKQRYSNENEMNEKRIAKYKSYVRKQTYSELNDMKERERASDMERCANLEILELFKVIAYLTESIPNGKQLLKQYYNPLNDKDDNGNIISSFETKRIVRQFDDNTDDERDRNVNQNVGKLVKQMKTNNRDLSRDSKNSTESDDELSSDDRENGKQAKKRSNDRNRSRTESRSPPSSKSRKESVSPTPTKSRTSLARKASQKKDLFSQRYPQRGRKTRSDNVNDDNDEYNEFEDDSDSDELYSNRKTRDPLLRGFEQFGRGKRKASSGRSYAEPTIDTNKRSFHSSSNFSSDCLSEDEAKSDKNNGTKKRLPLSSMKSRVRSPSPKPKQTIRSSVSSSDEHIDKEITRKVNDKKKARTPSPKPSDKQLKKRTPSPVMASRRGGKRKKEETGHFPCDFDKTQCQEVLTTKENYDFHMTGHIHAKYICPFCAYTGPTIQIVKRHITFERDGGDKEGGPAALEKAKVHSTVKMYECTACKKCHKIHERDEKRCLHLQKDAKLKCNWGHDIDHEFVDHLKEHMDKTFTTKMNSDTRKQKIKEILKKFVDDIYFANTAKKRIMISKFKITKPAGMASDSE